MGQFGGPEDGPTRPDQTPTGSPPPPQPPGGALPGSDGGRKSGISLETCYRHADQVTGVHCTRCGRPICTECMRPAAVGYQCPECLREAGASLPRRQRSLTVGGTGRITKILIAANVAVFVLEVLRAGGQSLMDGPSGRQLVNMGALYAPSIAAGQYWRLISTMFLHAGLLHIGFNMWALYILGPPVEAWYGEARFVAIYFVSGFLASVASFALGPIFVPAVGASGAIFGLLGAWLIYNFRRRENPMAYANMRVALILIVINLVISFSVATIDWRAHVGGLLAGMAAGFVAEGVGPRSTRTTVTVLGMAALVLLGVVVAVGRAATIRHTLGI